MKKNIYIISLALLSTILLSSCYNNDGEYEKKSKEMNKKIENNIKEKIIPVESNNGIGNGTESLDTIIEKEILTDDKGMTLYIFKKDIEDISNCSGECEVKWPVFYNENLKENGYSSIKREDGKMQTTINGQPLYYFFKDENAGDMKGEGLKDVWYTIEK